MARRRRISADGGGHVIALGVVLVMMAAAGEGRGATPVARADGEGRGTIAEGARIAVAVDADVGAGASARAVVETALAADDARFAGVTGAAPRHTLRAVRIKTAWKLGATEAAASTPGVIEVRATSTIDGRTAVALRHEAAHQFLWSACPSSSRDQLFHEAFAVWASGEAASWLEDGDRVYLSMPAAREVLRRSSLDARVARRAIARLVAEDADVPAALAERLRACADGASHVPLRPDDLGAHSVGDVDVLVVMQRATGEIVAAHGDIDAPIPYGSTLKPLLVAAARMGKRATPLLTPRPTDPMWACHLDDGGSKGALQDGKLDVDSALLLSCNGWFLDWGRRDTDAARFGDFGALLVAYGMSAVPSSMPEAIGVQGTLTIPPRGLALAYRALSYARPDVIGVLQENSKRGTLAGARALDGVATKTGTVRGASSAPDVGLLVAVTDDVVVVRARSGVVPRALVSSVADALRSTPRGARTVQVQVFGLLAPSSVHARCEGHGARVGADGVEAGAAVMTRLDALVGANASAVCTGAFHVAFDDDARGRPYLGVFTWSPPPPGAVDAAATKGQQRARRGSAFVFSTSLARYTAGVLASEDARATGAVREALGRVIAHNVEHAEERHGGRPACDTTHCQVFKGTSAPAVEEALLAPLSSSSFLSFSKGGAEPWKQTRPAAELRAALARVAGAGVAVDASALRVVDDGARTSIVALARSADGAGEDAVSVPCEVVRSALKLPSCPTSIEIAGTRAIFAGRGAGHGLGLDVERAKASAAAGATADAILRDAYGDGITAR